MLDKDGNMGLNYNYQTVTDNKYGFRLAHYLTNNPNDGKELIKLVNLTKEHIHTDDFTICVDNGLLESRTIKRNIKNQYDGCYTR